MIDLNTIQGCREHIGVLQEALRLGVKQIRLAAGQCDAWAGESRRGGWSTHQVQANTEYANNLRRVADTLDNLTNVAVV